MKKSLILLSSILISSTLLLSCNKNNNMEKLSIVLAEVNPETSICGRMDQAFKSKVEQLSKGKISVNIQYSGVLGNESQIIELMKAEESSVQVARVSANLTQYGGKKSGLITIPYTFANAEHFWKFAKSDIAKEILNEPYEMELGVKGLCYAQEGFRNFFSTTKIKTVQDMKNLHMRVSGKILPEICDSVKAIKEEIPFTDLYAALQTGTVDVADQPVSNYLSNSFYKVAPYMIMDGHMIGAVQILVSSTFWDSLSDEQKEILQSAADYASEYCRLISEEEEAKALEIMKNEGAEFTEVENSEEWQNTCKSIIESGSKEFPEIYKEIISLAK